MAALDGRVEAVRRFNRFYTQKIGVLDEGLLHSPYSLTEVRVLYELAHRDRPVAAGLGKELGLDAGYLSRILRGFRAKGLVDRRPSDSDGRQSVLSLTARGRRALAPLEARASEEIAALLKRLPEPRQIRLVGAMRIIESVLEPFAGSQAPYLLRQHQPGDMGWVVQRHGELYAEEYGWNERFEALVAAIVARFIERFDPRRERCWIAERDGERLGSVFLVKDSGLTARLRMLLVEPEARGLGIGSRLVDECVRFARQAGYRRIRMWTQSILLAARKIYRRAGFRVLREEPEHHGFGKNLIAETWELKL